MIAETIPALNSLSADQKILLAAELWRDAVGGVSKEPNPALVEALQERLDAYRKNPEQVSSWEQVRSRIVGTKNS
jgi:putative addiction module component (TIGR02574 family)